MIEWCLEVKLPTIWTDEKQRWEESAKSREEERRSKTRKSQKKEDPGARKGRKVGKHCVFPMICGSGGSKSHAVVARSTFPSQNVQNTPCSDHFWKLRCRKVHAIVARSAFRSQKLKAPHVRSTCRSCDVEKVQAVVAQSKFRSQKAQSTPAPDHFWKLRYWKSARRCGAKHISKSKVEKTEGVRSTFGRSDVVLRGRRTGLCTLSEVSKTWGFCSMSKNDSRRGTFEEDLPRWIFRGRRSTRDMFIKDARRSGRWFPERLPFGASDLQFWEDDFAWQVQHFVWPGLTFSWQAQYFRQVKWKNRKTHWYEAVSSALSFPFLKEVSQNCFVFDVVNFEKWGSLAELFRSWCCQVQKLRKSSWIAAFLMSSSKLRKSRRIASFSSLQIDRLIDW